MKKIYIHKYHKFETLGYNNYNVIKYEKLLHCFKSYIIFKYHQKELLFHIKKKRRLLSSFIFAKEMLKGKKKLK